MQNTAALDEAPETAAALSRMIDQYLPAQGGGEAVQDIVKFARFLWLVIRDTWEQFQLRLDQGLEAGRVRHAAASASLACDRLLRIVTQLDGVLGPEDAKQVEGLPELIAAAPKARAIRQAALALVDMLNAPEPPLDEARLADGLAAAARGDVEDTAVIVERLRTGGGL
jgi:hypothetical protein